ncbi:MAG: O-antigen ligase family protein, partial [Woeseiaceae bacterium]
FWTNDQGLALNTIFPAFNFVIILVLFAALLRLHWTKTVLTGMFFGFVFSAILYFVQTGFPLRFPADFSYNSIALVYLFGLYIVFQLASIAESKLLLIGVGAVILIHILATTSIKTNLGLLIGLAAAGVVYSRYFGQFLRKYMVVVVLALAVMGVGVASNDSLYQSVNRGASRIAIGVELLQARGDLPGYSAADERWNWQRVGIEGWSESPLFGNGVESFRSRVGITSHSTPIDLLYNSGLVGFMLFYSVLASLAMRVLGKKAAGSLQVRATVLVFGITFLFITLFGTMHYSAFLAAFIAMSAALLGGGQKIAADTVQSEAADK